METLGQPNLGNWRRIAGESAGEYPGKAASRRRLADLLPGELGPSRRRAKAHPGNFQGGPGNLATVREISPGGARGFCVRKVNLPGDPSWNRRAACGRRLASRGASLLAASLGFPIGI